MRLLAFLAALLAALVPVAGHANPSPAALCRAAIAAAERATGVPDRLMQAIGIVESGRPDERGGISAWPWTINVEGTGYTFDTKQQAIDAVNARRTQGARSIDVGCMQVNLMYHGQAFASLEQAFDPAINARYAADFLQRLLADTGSWPRAAAAYHSMTPDIGAEYARKVLAVWARPGLGDTASLAPFRRGPIASNLAPPVASLLAPAPGISSQPIPPSPGRDRAFGQSHRESTPLWRGWRRLRPDRPRSRRISSRADTAGDQPRPAPELSDHPRSNRIRASGELGADRCRMLANGRHRAERPIAIV